MANGESAISPKKRKLLIAIWILALIGFGVSLELTRIYYESYRNVDFSPFCAISQQVNCVSVALSKYSSILGLPVSGIGGLETIEIQHARLLNKGPDKVSAFTIPKLIGNAASARLAIQYGLRGPNHAVVTACSTGTHAIGDASRLIGLGDADVMVAGGTESPVGRLALAGFAACKALSTSHR